ncbi:lytic transglycosylase domain-containing protein [Labrys wisconsinensis]|uniref:Lytic transglycosylase n=1 Tax=Labrys wisconsinensis TaxID=425677 RepID=A0ABU0J1F4_9HYPH|nr:lytic transglycosylase domain-containing protein [Labrys wisconsinensis]MDQ0468084.1 hypothetical protein [Labrys wisconsinensis]
MRLRRLLCLILLCLAVPARAAPSGAATESPEQALCRLIETAATRHALPVAFLTRLIWRESSFRPGVVSSAGAQGIAQFMPGTAAERGLEDPFDPEQAIPASAHLLADLNRRFGSLGLAAAAYNAGPTRVAGWLAGQRSLPLETQDYVLFVTGHPAEDFLGEAEPAIDRPPAPDRTKPRTCLELTAGLRIAAPEASMALAAFAPWGVQLAGNFSKARALATYARSQRRFAAILGDVRPMVIGTRLRSRGTRAFYRVRAPAASRAEAAALCGRIHAAGGACIVLRS